MPIYEYYSPDTHRIYAFYARSPAYASAVPLCPDGEEHHMQKALSGFAIPKGRPEPSAGEGSGGDRELDDPRTEAALAEMEHAMAGLDEDNPDPRQLGALMRKMTGLLGEQNSPALEEMARRLEEGEDPEKLEEEYGDALDAIDPMGEATEGDVGSGEPGENTAGKTLRGLLRGRPRRDPELYELADYLPPAS